jgi:hypothetical protein
LQQKIENYQLLCEALEEHFVELRDKEKDKFKKALQQPQDLSLMVTGKPAKSPKVQGLLEDLAINSPLLTIDALLNDGEGTKNKKIRSANLFRSKIFLYGVNAHSVSFVLIISHYRHQVRAGD